MSTFTVSLGIADRLRERYVTVDALVDTGATYTSLPASILADLGIEQIEVRRFRLADNRVIEYPIGETRLRLENQEGTVRVMFAPDDEIPLIGATTLEILMLGIDPVAEKLVPVIGLRK